jgi:tetratricopeptide (TPR) repeat protein
VVFAKLERVKPATRAESMASFAEPSGRRLGWLDAVLLAASLGGLALIGWRWNHPEPPDAVVTQTDQAGPEAAPARPTRRPAQQRVPSAALAPVPAPTPPAWNVPALPAPTQAEGSTASAGSFSGFTPDASTTFAKMSRTAATRGEVDATLLDEGAALHERYPSTREVGQLLELLFENAAQQASARGRNDDAVRFREQAADALPERIGVWQRLIASREQERAWPDAERASRRALSALPDESALHLALARSLSQQGRDEEAADALRRRLTARNDPAARAYLAQLERALASVAGLAHQSSSHFSVSFEGQPDDALGRALVQTLEEKHAMLARTLDYEPTQAVPVILYPRATFLQTGAPGWSGANFSHGDGRIRVGTRDLSAGFVPLDLERTLTHELTHAFVFGRTRGALPLTLNEGLAQYLSGRRLGYRLDPGRVATTGERVKVDDFYDSALSFVEYLMDHYRQSTVNEVLKYTGETGSVEQAFRRALHQGYEETRQEWIKSLRSS